MSAVIALGYLGFRARDVDAWRRWATEVLGLQAVAVPAGAPSGHAYLRMDERAWRFAVEPGERGGLAFTGWEVATPGALDQLGNDLADAGVVVKEDTALARLRGVERVITCEDPDGYQLELFCGASVAEDPFVSPLAVRFVTADLGLGHILQSVSDEEAAIHFYVDLLGFRLSDIIEFGTSKVHFTRVNRRHHSLALVAAPRPPALGHFMVEVADLDHVGRALDRVHAGMGTPTETLGRHTNDHMVSFYMENPSGSQTEYGWGGRLVEEATWSVGRYTATASWGHKVPGSEYSAGGAVSPRATDR